MIEINFKDLVTLILQLGSVITVLGLSTAFYLIITRFGDEVRWYDFILPILLTLLYCALFFEWVVLK